MTARPLQAEAASEAAFFDEHGFVLLHARDCACATGIRAACPTPAKWFASIYPEIEQLDPRAACSRASRVEVQQWSPPLRRGRGTANPQYASGVHSDVRPDSRRLSQVNVEAYRIGRKPASAWRRSYERDEVEAFMHDRFLASYATWARRCCHMPLALCDPASVEIGRSRPDCDDRDRARSELPDAPSWRFASTRSQRWYLLSAT